MMRTFLTTVLMLLLGAPCPAWAAAESLLDDEEATKAETLKLLDATGAKARFVSVATINSDQDPDEDILLIDELGTVWLLLNERDCKFAKPQMIAGPVNDVPAPSRSIFRMWTSITTRTSSSQTGWASFTWSCPRDADGIATWRRSRTSSIPPAGPSRCA